VPSGERAELCRGAHAEQNAIAQAAKQGISVKGADMYCTTQPCIICTKIIINAGIKNVYYFEDYKSDDILEEIVSTNKITHFVKIHKSILGTTIEHTIGN
jgi:dCMP deaminase